VEIQEQVEAEEVAEVAEVPATEVEEGEAKAVRISSTP
jgi:hypothetical protein